MWYSVLYGELGLPNFTNSPSKIILHNLHKLLENRCCFQILFLSKLVIQ